MKDLATKDNIAYTWSILFSQSGNTLELNHQTTTAVVLSIVVSNRWVEWILFHLPFGYKLWNKALGWSYNRSTVVMSIPLDEGMLSVLAPEDKWLWNLPYIDSEEESNGTV